MVGGGGERSISVTLPFYTPKGGGASDELMA